MNRRTLGQTGIKVSEIAFGGVEIGTPYGIGIRSKADMISATEAVYLLQEALSRGINFFDTARLYGESESIMGRAFQDRRERVVICSKCRHFRDPGGDLPPAPELKKIIQFSLQESLRELKTDYLDVYMLHQADREVLDNEMIAESFRDLKMKGMIRVTGVSTYTVEETRKAMESGAWDVIQLPFNLMDPSQETLFPGAAEKGIGIVVRSVLMKGILSEKGKNLHPALKEVERHARQYEALLDDTIPDLAALALKFALSFGEVSTVLVGMDRMEYLQKALAAANGNYLGESALSRALELRYPRPESLDLVRWDRLGWLT